ncbi:MAG TPA: EamA family transporter [Candidatus Woesearchaeota archaeon]|jgi:drug/metabolite transporter (DMT)-like permease|nr:EamA family transporter [Candidatus Woesearchaeota archaeon]HJN56968.1 EamA family transporter [Candidatus Woesearchaeota archaeon]|tara:strand:- start:12753 stop:13136 length:384 start_codon:yes stop_codon:yes gene_type:complete
MTTKLWAMGVVLFCTLLTSTAQIFYKFGSETLSFDILSIITNVNLIIGILLYVVGGTLLIISLRGGEVTVLYPIFATSYIWVSFLSMYFLNEIMSLFKWAGVFTIIAGIIFIGYGSKKTDIEAAGVI